ncbi:glycosyltransferase [Sphingobacterium mizutaii]|uniref:glycosyltransferase n=1 Tax=Sphingobacterium mizutaii TaxID=1010 RepID=UPI00289A0D5D|nr:glycosyltransferase [Sphingobacterium mizutaii]
MRVLFVNDHPFYVNNKKEVFTSGTLDATVWKRYTKSLGELTVIGRGIDIGTDTHNYKLATTDNVQFDLFFNIKGGIDYVKYNKNIAEKLLSYIKVSDFIVLRLPSNIGVIAADICKKLGKKYIVEVVGCAFDSLWYYGSLLGKVMAPINFCKNKNAIFGASGAIYVTKYYLQARYPNNNLQINASNVVIEDYGEEVLGNHLKLLSQERKVKKIGMIGNVNLPYKGYTILFKALKGINSKYLLYIVGGGDQRWIKKLIVHFQLTNKVILLGRLNSRQEINDFLDDLDLYVQPSLTEGLPRSLIESMARGCPVIASNAGGIPELIPKEFIYDKKKSDQLEVLLERVLIDDSILLKMSKENFYKSKEYTFELINNRRELFLISNKDNFNNR